MKLKFVFLGALYFSTASAIAIGHEFRDLDQPGHRETIGDDKSEQTSEQVEFLNCAMSEYLKLDYVEACAIFKKEGQRFLECRYLPDTYQQISTERLSGDGDEVGNVCAEKAFDVGQSSFGKFFSGLWTSIFGES